MPAPTGKLFYLGLNRANAHGKVLLAPDDFFAFEDLLRTASEQVPMRILAYCLMPEHWHMVLWAHQDGDFARFVGWLTTEHAERWPLNHEPGGAWDMEQARFECTVLEPESLPLMYRHVERSPLAARLVSRAEDWKFGSLWWYQRRDDGRTDGFITPGPVPRPDDWIEQVNRPQNAAEFETIRRRLRQGQPA